MAQLVFPLSSDGPILEVVIGLPASSIATLKSAGQPVPPFVRARALLDTGCDVTAVAPWIVRQQGLPWAGKAGNQTAGGQVRVDIYEASLSISGPAGAAGPTYMRPALLVTELAHVPPNLDVLVGLDILFKLVTVIDGPGSKFSLTF
jgi:hypothetical protein